MKKLVIGAVITAVVLFLWQFLSWQLLNLHGSQMTYTANQAEILECLDGKLETGEYFVPRLDNDATPEEIAEFQTAQIGKPWALIKYNSSLEMSMGMNMLRGFVVDLMIGFIFCWILLQIVDLNMQKSVMIGVAVGLIGYLGINYLNSIWFQGNSLPDLIDAIVPWAIIGGVLGILYKK